MFHTEQNATVSQGIAAFCAGFAPSRLSRDDVIVIGRSLADTLAVGIGGRREPAAELALAYATSLGAPAQAQASAWAGPRNLGLEAAAFYNGVAAHALDYDDVTPVMRGHASAGLWPALLALAEHRNIDALRMYAAFAVGFEAMCSLAAVLAHDMYERGWHSSSVLGVLGATVACAYAIKLPEAAIVDAIGLAIAQGAGNQQSFGTMAKPLQLGHCAVAALRSVELARMGFSGPADGLEGPSGYAALHASRQSLHDIVPALGREGLAVQRFGFDIKKYPLCYATHRALDGVLALRRAHGLQLVDVDRVIVRTNAGALAPLVHPFPDSGMNAKFSMPYGVATALATGAVGLADFTDTALQRDAIMAFLPRVDVAEEQGRAGPRFAEVTLHLKDGRVFSQHVQALSGEHAHPLDDETLVVKVADCLRWGGCEADAASLVERLLQDTPVFAASLLKGLAP